MLLLLSFWLEIAFFNMPFLWRFKKLVGWVLATIIIVALFEPFLWEDSWILVVGLITPFRLLNIARVIKDRMHPFYLRRVTRRTSWSLCALFLLILAWNSPVIEWVRLTLPWLSLGTSLVMLSLLVWHVHKTRHITNTKHYSDKELPTVSVCIPARNETQSLEQCLRSVIANDYPKLEILVLDDCSQDRTAEVIKSFAQDGVRFVQGELPEDRWLAKNQAYDKLLREANGELILFCGVDVRFGSHAIKALVTTLLSRKKSMISVLPQRFYSKFNDAFVQPMRYWWELVPPRRMFNRPPVLSTCWLVNRKELTKAGGFASVSHAIIPEGHFARHFVKNDKYSFIRSDSELDVRTTKPFAEQWTTAIRTNYPQIRRRPEMALILTVFTALFMVGPYGLFIYSLLNQNTTLLFVSGINCVFLTSIHVLIMQISDPANVPLAFFTMPIAALIEILIGHTSMLKYEFGTVEWKDRNICIPVMHVYPRLPKA